MRRTNWSWVVLGILLAGCGGTGVDAEAVTTSAGASATTATSAATTTTAEAPTTTVAETTTTVVAGCDDAAGVETIERGETYPMDVDGDGSDDQVTTFFDDSDMPHYGLLVEYASGGSIRVDRPIYAVRQPLIPMGLYDVDGDGTAEMFVVEYEAEMGISYEPGSFTKLVVLQVGECSLSDTGDQGFMQIGHFPPQGVIAHCENDAVMVYDFYNETQDGTAFSVGVYEKTMSNGAMTLNRLENQEIPKQEMLDRPLFDCGDLQLPAELPPA